MRRFLAVLSNFFHSFLLCTLSLHLVPPTSLPSFITSFSHPFLGLPLNLVVSRFILNTLLVIMFPSTLCTCPNQHNLFSLIVSAIGSYVTIAYISLLVNILQLPFSLSYAGPQNSSIHLHFKKVYLVSVTLCQYPVF